MSNRRAGRRARNPAARLMQVRTLHSYIGMLIAPTVLFMSISGVLQIYDLHEGRPGYTPPPLLEKFGMLHKDQMFVVPRHGPPPGLRLPPGFGKSGPGARPGPPRGERHGPRPAVLLLKAFLTATAVGLILSTLLGLWMGLRDGFKRRMHLLLLLVGIVVPVVLAALSG